MILVMRANSGTFHYLTTSKSMQSPIHYTGYGGAKSHKGNGVNAVLQVNEAAKMASHISDDSCASTDGTDGYNEGRVSVIDG